MTTRSKILGCLGWTLWALLLGSLVWLLFAIRPNTMHGNHGKAISNGKQALIALKLYASSNKSAFPDTYYPQLKSANEVFREMFREGVITDERIVDAPGSVFTTADNNNTGSPPAYAEALKPGECHWMLLKYQTDVEHSKTPLLIENALTTSWPPRWDVSAREPGAKRKKGQAWPGGTIIVVRSDGSAAMEKLRPDGTLDWHSKNNLDEHGESWIDYLTPDQIAKLEYWDVEEKK